MTRSGITNIALTVVAGLLTAIPLLFPNAFFVAFVAQVPYFYLLLGDRGAGRMRLASAYRWGLCYYMSYYIAIYHWFLYLYPMEFTGFSRGSALSVVLVAWFGLSLLQASVFALIPLLFRLLCRAPLMKKHRILSPLAIAALWIIFEWLQTLTWAGVPWARLSVGQYSYLPMIQSAALLGSYFISFLIVFVNGIVALAILEKKGRGILISTAAALLVANIGYGELVLRLSDYKKGEREMVVVAAIQGNISSHEKWTAGSRRKTLHTYEMLSREAAQRGASLIVWPETVIPYKLLSNQESSQKVKDLARELGVELIVGTFISEKGAEGEEMSYNALLPIGREGEILPYAYKKRHLVPFGEYVPMEGVIKVLIPPLAELDMYADPVFAGDGSMLIEIDGIKIGALICFDSIYEELTRESVRDGAELLVLSTNDSWFFDSAAVYQHNGHAVMRAVESGRYLVRAANTGISSIIAPSGKIVAQLEPLVQGQIVAGVYPRDELTLYMWMGNVIVALAGVGLALIPLFSVFESNRKKIRRFGGDEWKIS